tara:strand:+ start:173 stop:397 length:225 start_codon:yes stop_codon:yes gene_type:complete
MAKPNNNFQLSVTDIEIIEQALTAKAGRRGMRIMEGDGDVKQLAQEATQIRNLLGRLHDQKNWFRPNNGIYVSG